MNKRFLSTTALALLLAGAASAQEALKSFSYVEVQGGAQLTSTNAPMDKLITPTAALSFGHYFSPVLGARLHVNAWQSKSGFSDLDQYYKWNYITPDLDLLVNLSSLFSKKVNHSLNVILVGGFGLNYAWDNDELKDLKLNPALTPLAWDDDHLSHNLRAGLRLETDHRKPFGISLEVNANSVDDRFNSKTNDADDWQFTAMLGLSFRFGHKYYKSEPERVVRKPVEQPKPVVETQPVVEEKKPVVEEKKPEKKAVVKQEPVKLHKVIYYPIRGSENESPNAVLKEVADFMKQYKNVKVQAVGYADKGTGTAEINKMYAKKRADQFKEDMVKNYGVSGAAITTDSKGDTVQPFPENDKNRCVIIDAEGTKEVTVYE